MVTGDQAQRTALIKHYELARRWIRETEYTREITWQESLRVSNLSEAAFLREYAWVVLNSGFRESVIRKHFDFLSLCFCDWESASAISENERACISSALAVFRNRRKLDAIANTARLIEKRGFGWLKSNFELEPIPTLTSLPFIGRVTAWHLAKNIGLDVAKPDRHLVRVADRFGYSDVNEMCRDIAREVGDRIAVADLVLWRFEERSLARSA